MCHFKTIKIKFFFHFNSSDIYQIVLILRITFLAFSCVENLFNVLKYLGGKFCSDLLGCLSFQRSILKRSSEKRNKIFHLLFGFYKLLTSVLRALRAIYDMRTSAIRAYECPTWLTHPLKYYNTGWLFCRFCQNVIKIVARKQL